MTALLQFDVIFNFPFSPLQVFCLHLSSLTLKWCTLKVWMTLGLSPP